MAVLRGVQMFKEVYWSTAIKKYRRYPHKMIEDFVGIKLRWYEILYYYTIASFTFYFSREARQDRMMKKY